MRTATQKGEFLLRRIVSTTNDELDASEKITHKLIFYPDIICIRSFIKQVNYVDFITPEMLLLRKQKHLEYLYRRGHIKTIIHELPEYFIQINKSTIINLNYITGRSKTLLELKGSLKYKVGEKFRENVEDSIYQWLSAS